MKTPGLLGSAIGMVVRKASRNYIAGPALEDAQRVSRHLAGQGYWIAQAFWDDGGEAPERVRDLYLAALDQLAGMGGKNYLSLKIPALHYDPALYGSVLAKSRESGVGLHFDSLAPDQAGLIHDFIWDHHRRAPHGAGCTLPGCWRRSLGDADQASELGLNVRVVKGQWEDPGHRTDPRAGFLQVIHRLAGNARCVRVATHDLPLARAALRRLKGAGTECELELLYGLPRVTDLVAIAREMDVPVRIYIAFGHPCLPYALASFRKNPRMALALVKEACRATYPTSFPACNGTY